MPKETTVCIARFWIAVTFGARDNDVKKVTMSSALIYKVHERLQPSFNSFHPRY